MIVVFGSVNLDLVTRVARFPAPGETVAGTSFHMVVGGKGANQALAAARAGAKVRLYGALGRDALAAMAVETLSSGGVDVEGLDRRDAPSGCAIIQVDRGGENCIVVVPGANAFADPDSVPDHCLRAGSTLLLQHEVPEQANKALIERASATGARVLLNAAPARPIGLDLLRRIDMLIVNETEAGELAAHLRWPSEPARFAAAGSASVESLAVVVTLGAAGAIVAQGGDELVTPAPRVDVFDTTGAGDAFVGTLAAALDGGSTLALAMQRAVAAGSRACTEQGARKPCAPPTERA